MRNLNNRGIVIH